MFKYFVILPLESYHYNNDDADRCLYLLHILIYKMNDSTKNNNNNNNNDDDDDDD
ncbi:hypothetical protein PIROE2DRAFT_18756 [Piromyces sp. E2]|nr:hypothetical protein PIROE2DRAFT_18756 [Piromyces sp. E2]|eukprot:OUM56577.1 hypothetical protein PIROE2DRAFT_18756 [Piromyces sp. E2]